MEQFDLIVIGSGSGLDVANAITEQGSDNRERATRGNVSQQGLQVLFVT